MHVFIVVVVVVTVADAAADVVVVFSFYFTSFTSFCTSPALSLSLSGLAKLPSNLSIH